MLYLLSLYVFMIKFMLFVLLMCLNIDVFNFKWLLIFFLLSNMFVSDKFIFYFSYKLINGFYKV